MFSVDELLATSFLRRPLPEKRGIVSNGKPKPELPNLKFAHKERTREYTRHFSVKQYDSPDWLTGCNKRNKLFCWPCLLFSTDHGVWSKTGFDDLRCLSKAEKRHEQTFSHLQNHLALKMFGKQQGGVDESSSRQLELENAAHNEMVRKNLEVMKRLIDCMCFLAKQGLPFRGLDASGSSSTNGNFVECLNLLRLYDPILDEHLRTATTFRGTDPSLQTELSQAIYETMTDRIKEELQDSHFISIMIDQTTDISCNPQLSTVLRYVCKGEVKERFVGFSDVGAHKSADTLFEHVVKVVSEYNIQDRLVAQSYDGAAVPGGQLDALQRSVQEKYPRALFLHCHAHVLNSLLQQSLGCLLQCRSFFKTLLGISAFFSKFPRRMDGWNVFAKRKKPGAAPIVWSFSSNIVATVCREKFNLDEFFSYLAEETDGIWDSETVIKAKVFRSFLREFQTVLFLEIFTRIFALTDVLFNSLKSEAHDIQFCLQKLSETKNQLQEIRDNQFEKVWVAAVENFTLSQGHSSSDETNKTTSDYNMYESMRRSFVEIVDNVWNQIDLRYQSFEKLEFCNLLRASKFPVYRSIFPDPIISRMKETYSSLFDFHKLKSELVVIYLSPDFCDKSVRELLFFLEKNDLQTVFPETHKLTKLILSLPSSIFSSERSSSGLKRIQTYVRDAPTQTQTSSVSIISIEKDILTFLRERGTLYDDVIRHFKRKTRRSDFELK